MLAIQRNEIVILPNYKYYKVIKERWPYWLNAHYWLNTHFDMLIQSDGTMTIKSINESNKKFLTTYWNDVIMPKARRDYVKETVSDEALEDLKQKRLRLELYQITLRDKLEKVGAAISDIEIIMGLAKINPL